MSSIYIQLIQRAKTLRAGDTVTLRFPLDTTHPERDLTVGGDIMPLLDEAESEYYVPDFLSDPARLQRVGQTLYRWLDGDERFLARAIEPLRGKDRAVALLIEQGAGLSHLPWELLHDGDGYLVQDSTTAIIPVRWLVGPAAVTEPQNRPLHVAFMATAPQGVTPELNFEGEEADILAATLRHPLRLSVEESGNLGELSNLLGDLGEGAVDVVHLTGHATHTAQGPRFLCEDAVGDEQPAGAQEIVESLTHTPRLLFLSGCRTGQAMHGGGVPSLAAELVATGILAVLGWGQPVFDPDATAAAATLYGALAQGLSPVRALAETYSELLRRHAQYPAQGRHWHLLRLYARGTPPHPPVYGGSEGGTPVYGGSEGGGVSVLTPLVTAPRTAGRARLTTPQREAEYLDNEQRVPVAQRADFVGRRRVLQGCLRALRRDAEYLGVILYGLGGHGKSTLAHRLRQRWLQRSEQHGAVVLYGALDEGLLLRKLNNGLASSPAARAHLNGRDTLRFRLRNALERCSEQLLIILDNFEDNFEGEGGFVQGRVPKLVEGRPLLTGATVQLLDDLLFALQGSNDHGQEHRLLLTSRYRPIWPGADALFVHQLDKLSDEAVQKKVTRLAPGSGPIAPDSATLRARAVTIADGNPRLLEWLFDLLAQEASATPDMDTLNMDAVLARMAEKESALRENILARELLAAQTPVLRQMLARGLVCELPVPADVFDALDSVDPALPNTHPERQRATTLGLLEATTPVTQSPSHPVTLSSGHLRVPRILAPLVAAEEQPAAATLAATAARTLYPLWWEADDANPSEAQQLELHRLALAGGETAIAQELAEALVGRWNRRDQYRYRETIELAQRTIDQVDATYDLLHQFARAQDFLGEKTASLAYYQQALALCQAAKNQNYEASILNNLGLVYSALGEKEEALRYYNLALPLVRQVGDRGGEATTLNNLGSVYDALGEKEEALRYYNLALPLVRQVGDRGGEATTLNNLGLVYSALGEKEEALRYYNLALPLRRQVGDRGGEATTLNNIGAVHYSTGDKTQAISYAQQAADLLASIGARWDECLFRRNIAQVHADLEEWPAAARQLLQAVTIARAVSHPNLSQYENFFNYALEQAVFAHLRGQGHADPAAHLATLSQDEVGALVRALLAG